MFVAKLSNYFGLGIERKYFNDNSFTLSLISCRLGKYRVLIDQHVINVSSEDMKSKIFHTTTLKIQGIKSFSEGKSVTEDICSLLSFASMSQVVAYEFEFKQSIKRISVIAQALLFRPVIDTNDGQLIKSFLESTWVNYRKLKRRRKLNEVIHMLTTCELTNLPLEVKLGQIFIILENLKSTYAKYCGIPFINGFYREISTPPKNNPNKEKRLSFENLLSQMLKDVNIKVGLKRIVRLRNEIIHFGLSRKPYLSLNNNYDFCHDVVREYLLKTLGYHGNYLIYSKACRQTKCI